MKALRSLSSASRTDPPSKSRRSSSRTPEPAAAPQARPTSTFAFTQINVGSFDRAEAFFEKVFGWRFVGEPTSPAFVSPAPARDGEPTPVRVAPPIAPPPDHRVNYFTPRKEVGQGRIAGGLFKFGVNSRAGNFGGRKEKNKGKGVEGEDAEEDGDGREGETKIPDVINYVAVEDITIALNAVRLAGGKTVVQPWMERDEMARFALFEDPEGNVFGLIQYLM